MLGLARGRLPIVAFVLVALIGLAGAAALWTSAGRTEALRFAAAADEATNRIRERVRLHLLLIDATAAMIEAQGDTLTRAGFAEYFDKLQLADRNPGIAGLGFAPLVRPEDVPTLERRLQAEHGRGVTLWPEPGTDPVAPVAVIGSLDPDPPPAIGYDMYSDPTRRAAMQAAIEARAPRATEPLKLATDAESAPGFIVYAPVYAGSFGVPDDERAPNAATGFAFGGFRTAEIAGSALHVYPLLPIAVTVADADDPETTIYAYGATADDSFGAPEPEFRSIEIAGQTWSLAVRPTEAFGHAPGRLFALGFAAISTVLAAAVAVALREQSRARTVAEALAAASQRSVAERDLLLQEMKHRIKNAIARILAIARQTATQAADLDAFTASFTRRLQAMAEAQDMLTRSATARADLGDLVSRELGQVFGADFDPGCLKGPKVELDATRTQALGLVFHELGTNALKYAGAPGIEVSWTLTGSPDRRVLDLRWRERGSGVVPPQQVGFGTRLIDATLRQELGGEVERDWRPEGLSLRMTLPL